ncbi:SPOR domain-containing protein [Vibrio sp. TH_r3]|uniref:SPOR domain-containing protein n=1 Tax=Vibrio sp. TH_r3 TaxID=3082084 RepID=UPI00295596C4|nr:SPOR domain-containing protein [Vibrio sp. TH_r3]MDV7103163.1 SPOR domain-containing protein [Vibrio sp. TH_r3]
MASKFQSRLVGTILLVAIGVIVLPDVLDGKKQHYKEELAPIPIKPNIETEVESFEVLQPVAVQTALPDSPVSVEQETSAADDQEIAVVVNNIENSNNYEESAWIIQLMALKNADNAKTLVEDLQKRGYQAHIKQEKEFTRVIIGPDISKSKLEKQINELQKVTGSKGQLMKFNPLNP